jgi:hypothetical protein
MTTRRNEDELAPGKPSATLSNGEMNIELEAVPAEYEI